MARRQPKSKLPGGAQDSPEGIELSSDLVRSKADGDLPDPDRDSDEVDVKGLR